LELRRDERLLLSQIVSGDCERLCNGLAPAFRLQSLDVRQALFRHWQTIL
jgi:hypothetical protein